MLSTLCCRLLAYYLSQQVNSLTTVFLYQSSRKRKKEERGLWLSTRDL